MAKSILQTDKRRCYLCGQPATWNDPLDKHHVFGGARRKKSEKYGLTVYLHHSNCHIYGKYSVHRNGMVSRALKAEAQRKSMQHYGWSEDDFRQIFEKSYL